MNANELLGVEVTKNAVLLQEYRNLLVLVYRIQVGQVDANSVVIGPGDCWKIAAPEAPPTEATPEPTPDVPVVTDN